MTIIKDGTGSGFAAIVSSENRLHTTAVVMTSDHHVNVNHKKYFSLAFDAIDPVGADDYFLYIKNTGTKNLHIPDIRLRSTVAGTAEVHVVTGTASFASETAITPTNRFVGDSSVIVGTFSADTNTTGLTSGGILFYVRLDTADTDVHLKTTSHIAIPPGQAISILWDTATGALSGLVSIFEEQLDI